MNIFDTDTTTPLAFRIVTNSRREFSIEKQVSRFKSRHVDGGNYMEVVKTWVPLAGDIQFSAFADSSADIYLNIYRKVYPSLELVQQVFNQLPTLKKEEKWTPI